MKTEKTITTDDIELITVTIKHKDGRCYAANAPSGLAVFIVPMLQFAELEDNKVGVVKLKEVAKPK